MYVLFFFFFSFLVVIVCASNIVVHFYTEGSVQLLHCAVAPLQVYMCMVPPVYHQSH